MYGTTSCHLETLYVPIYTKSTKNEAAKIPKFLFPNTDKHLKPLEVVLERFQLNGDIFDFIQELKI